MGIEDKQDNITPVQTTDLDLSLDKYLKRDIEKKTLLYLHM